MTVASHCNFPRLDNRKNSVDLIVLHICRQRPASINYDFLLKFKVPFNPWTSNHYKFQCLFFFFLYSFKFTNPEEFKITTRQITLSVNINHFTNEWGFFRLVSFGNLKRIGCKAWADLKFLIPHDLRTYQWYRKFNIVFFRLKLAWDDIFTSWLFSWER